MITINVHATMPEGAVHAIEAKLDQLLTEVVSLRREVAAFKGESMGKMDRLQQAVERTEGVVDSAVVLIKGLAADVRAEFPDSQKADEFAARLEAKADALAGAVAANPDPTPGDGDAPVDSGGSTPVDTGADGTGDTGAPSEAAGGDAGSVDSGTGSPV